METHKRTKSIDPSNTIQVSVVIPTYNRRVSLVRCLDALQQQTLDKKRYQVIVVNDGSPDDTAAFLEAYQRDTQMHLTVVNKQNEGPAVARNTGIEMAEGEFVAFLDDDCIPDPRWLEDLLEEFPDDPQCAGLGGFIHRLHDTLYAQYIDDVTPLAHQINDPKLNFLVTANAMYRKSVLTEIGGFDTTFAWAGGEDPELSLRITNLGYYLAATQKAKVAHDHRDSLKAIYKTHINYGKGMKLIVEKHKENINLKMNIHKYAVGRFIETVKLFIKRRNLTFAKRVRYFLADLCVLCGFYRGYVTCPKPVDSSRIHSSVNSL